MSRARESKLRTLMLRLHGEGVAVTFAKGRPGQPLADVFFVKIEDQDYIRILSEINEALDASAEAAYDKNTSIKYADAEAFVEQIREIKELSNEAERDKSIRPSGLREDDIHVEADSPGGGTVRPRDNSGGELHEGSGEGTDKSGSANIKRSNWHTTCPLLPLIGKA